MGRYWIYVYLKASWEVDAPKDALIDAYPVASKRAGKKEMRILRRRGYQAELHWVYVDLCRDEFLHCGPLSEQTSYLRCIDTLRLGSFIY